MDTSIIGLLLLGLPLGIMHALEVDHIAAVATITEKAKKPLHAAQIGAWWGLGHTLILFFFGSLVLLVHKTIPADISSGLEAVVGVMLIFLGIRMFLSVKKHKLHIHEHAHDGQEHIHLHSHKKEPDHDHGHMPLMVGLVHGLAGTGALLLLTLSITPSLTQGMVFMGAFGIGSIFGMAIMGYCLGHLLSLLAKYSRLGYFSRLGAATFSVTLGIYILVSNGSDLFI